MRWIVMTNVEFLKIINVELDKLEEECKRCEELVVQNRYIPEEKKYAEFALFEAREKRDRLKNLIYYPIYERIRAMSMAEVEHYRNIKLQEAKEQLEEIEERYGSMYAPFHLRKVDFDYKKISDKVEKYQNCTPEEIKDMWIKMRLDNKVEVFEKEIEYVSKYGIESSPEFARLSIENLQTKEKLGKLLSELRDARRHLKDPYVNFSVQTSGYPYGYPEIKEKKYVMQNKSAVKFALQEILESEERYEEIMQMYSSGVLKLNKFYDLCSSLESQINVGKIDENLINNLCKLGDNTYKYSDDYNYNNFANSLLFAVKRLNKNSKKIIKTGNTKYLIEKDKESIIGDLKKMYELLYSFNVWHNASRYEALGLETRLLPKPFEEVHQAAGHLDFPYWVNEMNYKFNKYRESFSLAKDRIAKEQEKISATEQYWQVGVDKTIKEIEELVGFKYEKLPYESLYSPVRNPASHDAIFNNEMIMRQVKDEAQNQADVAEAGLRDVSVDEIRRQRQVELNQMREELLNMTKNKSDMQNVEQEESNRLIR